MKQFLALLIFLITITSASSNAYATKNIITSFYPLAFMTEEIVGDKANVINMAGSVDVHAYQPTAQDLVKLNRADLVVFQGAELEPWTDSVIPELKSKGVFTLEVSHDLPLAKMEAHEDHHDDHHGKHEEHKDEHHEDEHHNDKHHDDKHHDDEHDEHAGHDEHGHNHGEFDPHTWLDPVLAQAMVDEILEAVIQIDGENKSSYQANAQALKNRFTALDSAYKTGLANCANDKLIISHDAYGYIASRYNFEFYSITGFSPQDEPSAKILAELKEKADQGITHILIEENNIRGFADTLARETGLATGSANPLGRGTLDAGKDFFAVMQDNLASFKMALNCS